MSLLALENGVLNNVLEELEFFGLFEELKLFGVFEKLDEFDELEEDLLKLEVDMVEVDGMKYKNWLLKISKFQQKEKNDSQTQI